MHMKRSSAEQLAYGLGWFSIALGVLELCSSRPAAQRARSRTTGLVLGTYGLREIVQGIVILASRQPQRWVWLRVAGDVLDMATLAWGLGRHGRWRGATSAGLASVLAVTAVDVLCALGSDRRDEPERLRSLRRGAAQLRRAVGSRAHG